MAAEAPAEACCGPTELIDAALPGRGSLGAELKRLGLTGTGVELGVKQGDFTKNVLSSWKQASLYVQVDLWAQQANYKDIANKPDSVQLKFMNQSIAAGDDMVKAGTVKAVTQCKGYTTQCVSRFEDNSLDLVYVDARHDRKGVLEDIQAYWPKLKVGGVMAGHDYLENYEAMGQDWALNYDGTRDESLRVVKGAVDDFFSGVPGISSPDLMRCPRQVTVSFEKTLNSWFVRKDASPPAGSPSCCAQPSTLWPLRNFSVLGHELRRVGLQGVGLELGAGAGEFSRQLISGWQEVDRYVQVDKRYGGSDAEGLRSAATAAGAALVEKGYVKSVHQCADDVVPCIAEFGSETLSFVYSGNSDASSERQLAALWPKLAKGGVLAGASGTSRKAIIAFFAGTSALSTPDLVRCPRQVMLSYRTKGSEWAVRK